MQRREFLSMVAFLVTGKAQAAAFGAIGDDGLLADMNKLVAISQGSGPTIHILVSAGCDHSNRMMEAGAKASQRATIRWIPFSNGSPGGTAALAVLIENGLDVLKKALAGAPVTGNARPEMVRIAEAQDAYVQQILARKLWNATGRPLAAPTAIYRDREGNVRAVRGSLSEPMFAEMVDAAA